MPVEIRVNNTASPYGRFLTWAPSPCDVRFLAPPGGTTATQTLSLVSVSSPGGGKVMFRPPGGGGFVPTLAVAVPTNGTPVAFEAAGEFNHPSTNIGDVTIEARDASGALQGVTPVMVRIRKDAQHLTAAERDRFLDALGTLNNSGTGVFGTFRDMHTSFSRPEAHGDAGFLPWHRAYLLDLERALQGVNPAVTIPYWRFDQPAPNVFSRDFLGETAITPTPPNLPPPVVFAPSNPLGSWATDGYRGVDRTANTFDPVTAAPPTVISQAATLGLGVRYVDFANMEANPHGAAHDSFTGFLDSVPQAARDPLFFLLHCNVDRLWAKWQHDNTLFDQALADAYDHSPRRIGHNVVDSMWPWNGVTLSPRPSPAPGGGLPVSPGAVGPPLPPVVGQMLDYQGRLWAALRMGFDYDDVPFI